MNKQGGEQYTFGHDFATASDEVAAGIAEQDEILESLGAVYKERPKLNVVDGGESSSDSYIDRAVKAIKNKQGDPLKITERAIPHIVDKILKSGDEKAAKQAIRLLVDADRGGRGTLRVGELWASVQEQLMHQRRREAENAEQGSATSPKWSILTETDAMKWAGKNYGNFVTFDDKGNMTVVDRNLAVMLIDEFHLHRLYDDVWGYNGICYLPFENEIKAFVLDVLAAVTPREAKDARAKGIVDAVYTKVTQRDGSNHLRWFSEWNSHPFIPFRNGVLDCTDLDNIVLREHDPKYLYTYWVNCDWDETENDPIVDQFLNSILPDSATNSNLIEWLGYTLAAFDTKHQYMAMLIGGGKNGKGMMLSVVTSLLGNALTAVSLQQLAKEKFDAYSLCDAVVNVVGDMSPKYLDDTALAKQITGGDPIRGERKFHDPFTFKTRAACWFGMNKLPPTADTTHGYFRRPLIFPFNQTFDGRKAEADPDIERKITTESAKSTWARRAVEGYVRLAKRGSLVESDEMIEKKEQYKVENDLIAAALKKDIIVIEEGASVESSLLKRLLKVFAEEGGRKPLKDSEVLGRLQQLDSSISEHRRGPKNGRRVWMTEGVGIGESGAELRIEKEVPDLQGGTIQKLSVRVVELFEPPSESDDQGIASHLPDDI